MKNNNLACKKYYEKNRANPDFVMKKDYLHEVNIIEKDTNGFIQYFKNGNH